MKIANISYTKNNLSQLLQVVRDGEAVMIVDRNRPVARLEPVAADTGQPDYAAQLVRDGLVRPPAAPPSSAALAALPWPAAKGGRDIVRALLRDREEGR